VDLAKRQQWMATLAKAPFPVLKSCVDSVEHMPDYSFLRSPETGLTMVRGRAGGTGQVFNLGEMTLTRCVVRLFAQGEDAVTGFGYVGGRSHQHAELAALCDGLLQHPDWHETVWEKVIEPLAISAAEKRKQQQSQTAATKVDFFTMLRGE